MPYYLLIVGDPETIPFRFQYQLDVQYGVGRIHFDTVEEYARYARSASCEAETTGLKQPRSAACSSASATAATKRPSSAPTNSSGRLAGDAGGRGPRVGTADHPGGGGNQGRSSPPCSAGRETPAFLFTASHGMGFPKDHPLRQLPTGRLALPGLARSGGVGKTHPAGLLLLPATTSPPMARAHGLIAFHFACYGAGTPKLDDFAHQAIETGRNRSACLPGRLPAAAAGASQRRSPGHHRSCRRAWGYSFVWSRAGQQLEAFQSTLDALLSGPPRRARPPST